MPCLAQPIASPPPKPAPPMQPALVVPVIPSLRIGEHIEFKAPFPTKATAVKSPAPVVDGTMEWPVFEWNNAEAEDTHIISLNSNVVCS